MDHFGDGRLMPRRQGETMSSASRSIDMSRRARMAASAANAAVSDRNPSQRLARFAVRLRQIVQGDVANLVP